MRTRIVIKLVTAIIGGWSVIAQPSVATAQDIVPNIAYGNDSDRQKLDLYRPDSAPPHPVLIFIHGGGFMSGNKRAGNARHIVRAGLDRGYAVASLNYRRSGEALFPAAVEDVLAAIGFLRMHASAYGLDSDRLATWGASAGGNLSAMAATLGSEAEGTHVQAAVNWFGPIVFDEMDAQFGALGIEPALGPTNAATSPESRYIGIPVGDPAAAELVRRASPQSYISPDDPPMLVQHGTEDRNIPIQQSRNFAGALAAVIGQEKVEYIPLAGAGHGGGDFLSEANMARIFAFLDKHLGR
ncbi:MAG: alpha/beta hydrolase [Pseudomonadota bacterium]